MRKKLLSEAQVRRFQSLASIQPLNEMGDKAYKKDDEEHMEEMAYKKDDEEHMEEALYEEEEPAEIEASPEAMEEADVELDEELVEKFMEAASTIQQVADALNVEADGKMGDDMEMDLDMDMEDEEGGEELPAPEAEESPEDDEDEAMLKEALSGISYIPSQKEIVKTVAKRVAKRLQEAKVAQARLNKALGKRK